MANHPIPPAESALLDRLCERARAASVPSEFEVARLRRSVATALAGERRAAGRPVILRPLALASSMAIAIFALMTLMPSPGTPPAGAGTPVASSDVPVPVRTASGAVAFRLPEGRTVQVTRAATPRAEGGETETARGIYVDRARGQAPGTVVFYRFD